MRAALGVTAEVIVADPNRRLVRLTAAAGPVAERESLATLAKSTACNARLIYPTNFPTVCEVKLCVAMMRDAKL